MVNMMNLVPGEWENYADETEHYCYVRCLDLGKMYEAVCVRHINGTDDANYLHQVFFPEEWCEEALVELLQRFEYENLDDFRSGHQPRGFRKRLHPQCGRHD